LTYSKYPLVAINYCSSHYYSAGHRDSKCITILLYYCR